MNWFIPFPRVRNNARDAPTSRLFWFVLTKVFKAPVVRHQLMMKGMTSRMARIYDSYPEATRTVAGIVGDIGYKHAVIEVENARRGEGSSNYGFFKRFDLMIDMIISIAVAPLKILIYAGLAGFIATLMASIYFLTAALFHSVVSGVTVLILAVCLFGSLMILGTRDPRRLSRQYLCGSPPPSAVPDRGRDAARMDDLSHHCRAAKRLSRGIRQARRYAARHPPERPHQSRRCVSRP